MAEKINPLKTLSGEEWRRLGTSKRAGILAPLFSVYSNQSTGIGDLADLKVLVDLAAEAGASIIQLLPMNEVGSTFCPYDAVSSFALEPSYISLNELPGAGKRSVKEKIEKAKKDFPSGAGHVNYAIKEAKREILWDAFCSDRANTVPSGSKKFTETARYWLDDFTLYKVLKNHHSGRPWYDWPEEYKHRDGRALKAFAKEHEKEIAFQEWVQHTAFRQFSDAREYAASKGVLLKGDLPILISRDSADVWAHPGFFKLDFAAGAPPDLYCAKGQRWGMPTYEWSAIEADGRYRYLREKLKFAENFYDILRIDHVVGLFRIWSIPRDDPAENEGLNGVFDPSDEKTWEDHGRKLLSVMLESTDMLLCAEDLGIIPKACPTTLKEFGIPGNEVQRWVKDWEKRHDFLPPGEYRQLSVSMLSTHDTTNWAAWWENEAGTVDEALFVRKCRDRGIDFEAIKGNLFDFSRSRHGRLRWQDIVSSREAYMGILGKREEELADFLDLYENTYHEKEKLWAKLGIKGPMRERSDAEIVSAALGITLASRSIFCIELIIDYLYTAGMFKGDPYQYRVNKPGTVAKTNWSLTMPLPLEDLIKHKACGKIKKLIADSGRV